MLNIRKKMAAAIPPAAALVPPIKAPIKPDLLISSMAPLRETQHLPFQNCAHPPEGLYSWEKAGRTLYSLPCPSL